MTSDLPAGDVIVLHDDNGRHAYHALTLAMVALDALSTDQSSRALGCAQGARCGCPKAAASSLEQIVCTKAPFFTHPKDIIGRAQWAARMLRRRCAGFWQRVCPNPRLWAFVASSSARIDVEAVVRRFLRPSGKLFNELGNYQTFFASHARVRIWGVGEVVDTKARRGAESRV